MIVTISRRGTSEVPENWFVNTATSTTMGMAFNATASGPIMSLSTLKRISRKLMATPSSTPRTRPTSALVPDTTAASQMNEKLSTNARQMADGGVRKYGFQSNTLTASSHAPRNTTPNTTGGHTADTIRRACRAGARRDRASLDVV